MSSFCSQTPEAYGDSVMCAICMYLGSTAFRKEAKTIWQFVWIEVLQSKQPNGVMSSVVSLPNPTFTGQASSSKRLISIVHILLPETDNCPSWISGRKRMTTENISWSISMADVANLAKVEPATSWSPSDVHPTKPLRPATILTNFIPWKAWNCFSNFYGVFHSSHPR